MADRLQQAAERLRAAYSGGAVAPLRDILDPLDADGAYAIQALNTRFWESQGRRIVGRKIGLTAKAVQQQLGVDRPDFGVLFDDMRVPDGGTLNPGSLLQPKAEAEIALIIGRDLNLAEPSMEDIFDAAESVVAAIEIVDSRIADWKISFADTVADNGSSAYFVLGEARRPLAGTDFYSCGMVLEVDGQIASIGAGAACLGHPLRAAAWLAGTLAQRGEPLRAGDFVLTGALGPMVPLSPGQKIRAVVGGIGEVGFTYGDEE